MTKLKLNSFIYLFYILLLAASSLTLIGCAGDKGADGEKGDQGIGHNRLTSTEWVAAADWDTATTIKLTLGEPKAGVYSYTFDTTGTNELTLISGNPYILQIINPATNAEKHYLSTKSFMGTVNMPGDFYKAIAVRKAQTADAEYKAPYFRALELLTSTTDRMIELYFVPVLTGSYYIFCQQSGHESGGMAGKITIEGEATNKLDLEVDPLFDTSLLTADELSGSHKVWKSPVGITVAMTEGTADCAGNDYCYTVTSDSTTDDFTQGLNIGTGYKITLSNAGTNEKHYFTAPDFFKSLATRKAQDSHGEIKVPYFNAVELRNNSSGTATDLYVVPKDSDVGDGFHAYCTVGTHAENGMRSTVVVN